MSVQVISPLIIVMDVAPMIRVAVLSLNAHWLQ